MTTGLLAAFLALPWSARAHDADVIYVLAQHGARDGALSETVTLTGATLRQLAPVDADGDGVVTQAELGAKHAALRAGVWDDMPLLAGGQRCELSDTREAVREGFVELQGEWRCGPGELRQDFRLLRVLAPNYRVVLGSQVEGEQAGRAFAQGSLTTIAVPRPAPPGTWDAARFEQGFTQGLRRGVAPDALLAWVAVLLAVARWRRGFLALGLALVGALGGGWLDLGTLGPTALIVAAACAAAVPRELPVVVALVLGAAVATRAGGGPFPMGFGQGCGVAAALGASGVFVLPAAVLLARRPRAQRVARIALAAGCVLTAGLGVFAR